jgi:carboxyl-terminal processing protease
VAVVALAIAIASFGVQFGREVTQDARAPQDAPSATLPNDAPEDFSRVFEAWQVLKREHFQQDSLDATALSQGAVRGMLQALNDPYAVYLTQQQYKLETQEFKGSFEGIGAEVTMRNGRITVVAPIPDTPAAAAGIRPGDVILKINGESTQGISLQEAVNKIRGPRGESVDLVIAHKDGGEPVAITVVRDSIKVKSARLRMLVGGMAHLRITSFTETTAEEVREELKKVRDFESRGLILDVRNNPGGLLRSVVDVTSQFLEGGLVLYEMDGHGQRKDWPVDKGGLAKEVSIVILMNEGSASGAEVLAGALVDQGRATTIGTKTFGKGSVNTLRELKDGSGMYFTIARWYTPNGTLIEGEGVAPDILVEQSEDGSEDLQLDKAIEVLEAKVRALQ